MIKTHFVQAYLKYYCILIEQMQQEPLVLIKIYGIFMILQIEQ